jgi:hypothetical protein
LVSAAFLNETGKNSKIPFLRESLSRVEMEMEMEMAPVSLKNKKWTD